MYYMCREVMEAPSKSAADILFIHSSNDMLTTSYVSVIVLNSGDPMVRPSLQKENKLGKHEEHN